MYLVERAWLYITRKRGRSIIMLGILFLIATAMISGIAIKKAAQESMQMARESLGGSFSMVVNFDKSNPNIKEEEVKSDYGVSVQFTNEGPPLSEALLNKISAMDGIKTSNGIASLPLSDGSFTYSDLDQGTGSMAMFDSGAKDEEGIPHLMLQIDLHTQLDQLFQNGTIRLIEGTYIQKEDRDKVLVDREFAEQNNLVLGDKLSLEASKAFQNENGIHKVEVEIAGIFETIEQAEQTYLLPMMMPQNQIITNANTGKQFRNDEVFEFDQLIFYTEDPANMEKLVAEVKDLDIDWRHFLLDTNDAAYQQMAGMLDQLNQIITMILYGIFIIACIIMTLILSLWIKGRVHETGILLSLGIAKVNIIAQYIAELMMIAALAFTLAFFSGKMISQSMSDFYFSQLQKQQNQNDLTVVTKIDFSGLGEEYQAIEELDVEVNGEELIAVYALGSLLIVVSILCSSLSILRLKPKEILSKMS